MDLGILQKNIPSFIIFIFHILKIILTTLGTPIKLLDLSEHKNADWMFQNKSSKVWLKNKWHTIKLLNLKLNKFF